MSNTNSLDYLIVYGDSYSDIHQGTKRTNGPVWSQRLATQWNTQLVSFAKSGATFCENNKVNGSWLKKQALEDTITSNGTTSKSTVHAIFLGVTDLIETKGEVKNISEWLQCIKDQVLFINSNNPNSRIIIMGVPALEFSPYATAHKTSTAQLKQNIIDFNVALEEEVLEWGNELSAEIEFFDTYLVFSDVLGDPSVANIENVDDAYWETCQGQCKDKVDDYLWWDNIHVTGSGQKAIANTILSKEFFNMKGLGVDPSLEMESSSSDNTSFRSSYTSLPSDYTNCLSWLALLALLGIILYLFRHNRAVVSLKKKLQTKASKVNPFTSRNHSEYTIV
ncbi:uncharacterized protein BX663DRAFT_530673 [Cokeromyces recurvatus]|uniref:uncharacterized protein n=1 Tax=Cokeromyces recurvatus TaxID=90255 RepID=UPI00221FB8D4|nr:uncharacterized protein BX663DRAFT_530673 [Cokeromyces recurvatus]KAI7904097.1 hypothetical protein BX663DRAFT_530673 [Cokeromyces recurvatus]